MSTIQVVDIEQSVSNNKVFIRSNNAESSLIVQVGKHNKEFAYNTKIDTIQVWLEHKGIRNGTLSIALQDIKEARKQQKETT